MVNVLLSSYGRYHTAMCDTELVGAQDELKTHELKQLVLRERSVAWADQAEANQDVQGSSTGTTKRETKDFGGELAPVLSFSKLLYFQSSPCSKSSWSLFYFLSSLMFLLLYKVHLLSVYW